MDGVAARGLMSGRGPLRRSGRDEVGTCSDEAKQNSAYSHFEKSRVNPCRRNATFLCEDPEKRSQNGISGPKQQSLQKNQPILLQGLLGPEIRSKDWDLG